MFFETKYGKIFGAKDTKASLLGMFFETKYGKIEHHPPTTEF